MRSLSLSYKISGVAILVIVALAAMMTLDRLRDERAVMLEGEVKAARALVLMSESVREGMENKWAAGLFSPQILRNLPHASEEELRKKVLAAVPVVGAWEAAQAKSREAGFEFRTPREGPRNTKNVPDAVELEALRFFAADPKAREYFVHDEARNALRYFRPVRLTEACLYCHGDPAHSQAFWGRSDGLDITGYSMENKSVGDLHGAFEVIKPLDALDEAMWGSVGKSLLSMFIGVVLAALVLMLVLKRWLFVPLTQAVGVANRLAGGDLSARIDMTRVGGDEMGVLLQSLDGMSRHLAEVIQATRQAAGGLAEGADQVEQTSSGLARAAGEQASRVTTVVRALQQMNEAIHHMEDAARQTQARSESAVSLAESGSGAVQDTMDRMRQIADVVKLVDDIAYQTNLLALNAAIEASRAGDAGREFGVVADEVRKLAERSRTAAARIGEIAEQSVEVSEQAAGMMGEVTDSIRETSTLVRDIARQMREQSGAVDALERTLSALDGVTARNAEASAELSATAKDMNAQARGLREQVEFFH